MLDDRKWKFLDFGLILYVLAMAIWEIYLGIKNAIHYSVLHSSIDLVDAIVWTGGGIINIWVAYLLYKGKPVGLLIHIIVLLLIRIWSLLKGVGLGLFPTIIIWGPVCYIIFVIFKYESNRNQT